MRHYLFIVLLILAIPSVTKGQCAGVTNCTAASANASDVQAALNSINLDGTVVHIPATGPSGVVWGNLACAGTSPVSYSGAYSFTLMGASNIVFTGTPGQANYTFTDDGGTTIVDHVNHMGTGCQDIPDLALSVAVGKTGRLTGVSFVQDSQSIQSYNGFALSIAGNDGSYFRVDHSHFTISQNNSLAWATYGTYEGVFDHVVAQGGQGSGFRDHTPCNGDADWTVPGNFGTNTSGWRYYESSIFNNFSNDGVCGGRMVYRFNTQYMTGPGKTPTEPLQTHATSSAGDGRGQRAFEVYGNSFDCHTYLCDTGMEITGGTGLVWGNVETPTSQASCTPGANSPPCGWHTFMRVAINRSLDDPLTYDYTAPPGGWGYCGTANGSGNGVGSAWDENNPASSGHRCIDAPGNGAGDLLSGNFPNKCNITLNPACNVFTGQWPRQAHEPLYEWMDAWTSPGTGGSAFWGGLNGTVTIQNSDIYLDCSAGSPSGCTSFNGTVGVGHGALLPTNSSAYTGAPNCTTGVAYWYTAGGSWNQSGNGFGNGVLYECTATNTWTLYYTPLTYPHPLAGGGSGGSVTLSTSSEAFGNVNVGSSSATQVVTLTNSTVSAITISSGTTTGTNPLDFPNTANTCTNGFVVAANGGQCAVTTKFSPSIAGVESATLKIFWASGSSSLAVSLSGTGISATGNSYSTMFPATENPISQSGAWISGHAAGTNSSGGCPPAGGSNYCFADVKTIGGTPGKAEGTIVNSGCNGEGTDCNDSTAVLTGTWGPVQTVQGTIYTDVPSSGFDEVELRLLTTISAGSITGYEITCGIASSGSNYFSVARWNGPLGNYTSLGGNNSAGCTNGDVIKATVDANGVITLYKQAGGVGSFVQEFTVTDTTFRTGSPGIGFFTFSGNVADFGLTNFSATDTGSGGVVTISPSAENFGSITVGVTSPGQTATVLNTTASAITVGTINYTGMNPLDFATSATTCSGTVAASGGSCTITTTFKPGAAGSRSATLNFNYSGGSSGDATVVLSGTGGAPQVAPCTETQTTTPNVAINVGRHVGETESGSTNDSTQAVKPSGVCHAIP